MNKKRLLKLADFLETVPRKRFNFKHWVGDDWEGKPDLSCGTTACAVGWACSIPSFRRAGLKLRKDGWKIYPTFGAEIYFEAVSLFFEINVRNAFELFCPKEDHLWGVMPKESTPKQIARHIRKFVAREK